MVQRRGEKFGVSSGNTLRNNYYAHMFDGDPSGKIVYWHKDEQGKTVVTEKTTGGYAYAQPPALSLDKQRRWEILDEQFDNEKKQQDDSMTRHERKEQRKEQNAVAKQQQHALQVAASSKHIRRVLKNAAAEAAAEAGQVGSPSSPSRADDSQNRQQRKKSSSSSGKKDAAEWTVSGDVSAAWEEADKQQAEERAEHRRARKSRGRKDGDGDDQQEQAAAGDGADGSDGWKVVRLHHEEYNKQLNSGAHQRWHDHRHLRSTRPHGEESKVQFVEVWTKPSERSIANKLRSRQVGSDSSYYRDTPEKARLDAKRSVSAKRLDQVLGL